ncbi:hypothetical protein B4589_014890 [Halolamina sp. CBA1230]|uniref:DUF7284 family protein n=1 Tax=Halolamina sp. CBA1230 TaxID=1853690 RepID=UPI0009A23331|nr:hypothetical protein [Halolamina sp. CBA1230]QKY21597.1 hypothetical protein B4589_014890 [Halolamina sp. CBA1230]
MTATALDACLCLLLISAAAVTVTSAPSPTAAGEVDRADAVAETLAATTVDVPYTLLPVPNGDGDADTSPEFERVAHGTLASLLADAAVRTVRVDAEPLTGTNERFAAAVRTTVADQLPSRTRVVVRWEPFPGVHLSRSFAVGPTPPEDVDVNAATVRAPSGVDPPANASTAASEGGFTRLSRVVADSLVAGLLPPDKGRLALADDAPLDDLVRHRYRQVSDRYGVETAAAIERGDTRAANRKVATAMAERVASDLRDGAETPADAASSLELGTVEISVRTWSP